MWKRRIMTVVWPAFLVAGVLEMLVFATVDPHDLHWFGQPLEQELSRQGLYTLAFFVFWAVTCVSSALTMLLGLSSAEVNEGTGAGGPRKGRA